MGTEVYFAFIRHLLYNYVITNQEEILTDFYYIYYKGNPVNTDEYINLIQENGNYRVELECNVLIKFIPINILLLTYHLLNDGKYCYNYYNYYRKQINENYIPLFIMDSKNLMMKLL